MTHNPPAIEAFQPFYAHLVPEDTVADRVGPALVRAAGPGRAEPLLLQVRAGLVRAVETHAFRTLIKEFHAFREEAGLPASTGTDTALRRFRLRLEDPAVCRDITDRHPVLRDRLRTVVANGLDAHAEVFAAFDADRAALREAGLLSGDGTGVADISGTGSDLHNDNRQVVRVHLTDGTRLVFKPRPLGADAFVRDLFAAAEPRLRHSLADCVPSSVTAGEHGWQRYVVPSAMDGADQPERYFYRFGALCALLGAIGASDLHDENLLAAGEHPCLIDTETVLRPDPGEVPASLPKTLVDHLKLSVASTVLIPMVDPNGAMDMIVAGVGVEGDQASRLRRPALQDTGTDNLHVRWENLVYRHRDNVPRLGADALSPVDHFPALLAGYRDALGSVRGDGLGAVLDAHRDMPVRCLIRSTMIYSRFLDAATHPDYLVRPEEADRLLRLLGSYPEYLGPAAARFVGDGERAALDTGNVPYFVTRADSTALAAADRTMPAVYTSSPLDFARRGLAVNGRRSDAYHHFLLEECFGELCADRPGGLSPHSVFADACRGARPGRWWPAIARTVDAVAVRHDGPDGPETGWVSGIGPGRNAPTLTPGNFISFHDAGGIVAFLRNAALRDPALGPAGRAAERGLDALLAEYGDILLQVPEGIFTGGASLALTRPDRDDPDWTARVLARITEAAQAGTLEADLANGPAGTLMVLLSRTAAGREPRGTRDLARLVRSRTASLAAPWYDLAHGELGLRWAAARTGRVLDDPALGAASADWLEERLRTGDRPEFAGWCKGAAGLLLASAEILVAAGRPERLAGGTLAALVDRATAVPDGPVDLSVCHGTSGAVQSLVAAAGLLGEPALLERAVDLQERAIATAVRHGFHLGAPGRTSLLGYMFGWAGVGDTDLLLAAALEDGPDVPVPVALRVPADAVVPAPAR
ncbi:DUF4135 domain-containing protein [Streptomyces sp. NBC_00525]|uniref:DUF4135 domain-containing protein n=1 Tax=Streptomyces sp. NBC_00525 TaxID=2903660 RepID=UPI002E805A7B|nr:DUF4135 domain-containing protein [Streptomyces sp. NBC_00525]WUC94008.1 DUF4135 domain-containing protein [Streptomyces sp. NBC_00525]